MLMAGLVAVTHRIELVAAIAVLTMPQPIAACRTATIDWLSPRRSGMNIVSGWHGAAYSQMDIRPGASHFARRHAFCAEYVQVMREVWGTGRQAMEAGRLVIDAPPDRARM